MAARLYPYTEMFWLGLIASSSVSSRVIRLIHQFALSTNWISQALKWLKMDPRAPEIMLLR